MDESRFPDTRCTHDAIHPRRAAKIEPSATAGFPDCAAIKIKVQYMGEVRVIVGRAEEEIEFFSQPTVQELLRILSKQYKEEFDREVFREDRETSRDDLVVAVNGIGIAQLDLTKTVLKQGDIVMLFPIFPGGG